MDGHPLRILGYLHPVDRSAAGSQSSRPFIGNNDRVPQESLASFFVVLDVDIPRLASSRLISARPR